MICEKCNKQFKSELSAVKTGTMMGICTSCGRRLKYNDIPEGYATGAILAFASTPLFFLSLFSWAYFLSSIVVIGGSILAVWLLTGKYGGYIVAGTLEEYKRGNIAVSFSTGIIGAAVTFCWLMLSLRIFV
jgi:hypothetical protein